MLRNQARSSLAAGMNTRLKGETYKLLEQGVRLQQNTTLSGAMKTNLSSLLTSEPCQRRGTEGGGRGPHKLANGVN